MNLNYLTELLGDRAAAIGVVALAGLSALTILLLVVRKVRKIAKSDRPDEPLSNLGMLIGLGWSSEAVWTLTGKGGADLITPFRVALFAIFEVVLIVFMIRAKFNVRIIGHPGRAGKYAWAVAAGMSLVAVWIAHNPGEAFLRLLVPVLLTSMWWDGLVGEGKRKQSGTSSWRWTPRRLLLALGAIEPGERDIETVHRERVTQQMTRLYFKVKHGSPLLKGRRETRLSRLSLVADDDIIAEVMQRVDRATWFEVKQDDVPTATAPASRPAARAASPKSRQVLHRPTRRALRVKHPVKVVFAAQEPEPDPRSAQEIDDAIRVMKTGMPVLSQRQIAHFLRTSDAKVGRALRRKQNPSPPPIVNGRRPELEGANQ